jgi:hypothetical protein
MDDRSGVRCGQDHTVSAVPTDRAPGQPVECSVEVADRPAIVAMWPRSTRFGQERAARLEPQSN